MLIYYSADDGNSRGIYLTPEKSVYIFRGEESWVLKAFLSCKTGDTGIIFSLGRFIYIPRVALRHFQGDSLRNRKKKQPPLSFVHRQREWLSVSFTYWWACHSQKTVFHIWFSSCHSGDTGKCCHDAILTVDLAVSIRISLIQTFLRALRAKLIMTGH